MLDYLRHYALKFGLLPKDKEYELIKKAQAGDRSARETIFNHHLRDIFFVLDKQTKSFLNSGYNESDLEDLCSIMCEKMYKVIMKFHMEKGFAMQTYVVRCMTNEVYRYFTATHRKTTDHKTLSIGSDSDWIDAQCAIKKDDTDISTLLDNRLSQEQEFMLRKTMEGYTNQELSRLLGMDDVQWKEQIEIIKVLYKDSEDKRYIIKRSKTT